MKEKVVKFHGNTLKSQAKIAIYDDSEIVNREVIKIKIKYDDIGFWSKFLMDWSIALEQMHKRDKKLLEQGSLKKEDYEVNKKTRDLALTTLAILNNELIEWIDTENSDFIYKMNAMDCYFIPAYLDDYKTVNKLMESRCETYIQAMLHALSLSGNLDERLEAIETLMDEYIEIREPIYFK